MTLKLHGYDVLDYKLVVDGKGNMVAADRMCDCCYGRNPKVIKANLEGKWRQVKVCRKCLVKEGYFLSQADLLEEVSNVAMGRGRG